MKLRSFRVTNYRCIDDSGEVPVENIKTLVGKNESGKTSILRALHKFNPASPEPYNGLKEFPRWRFHEYDEKAPVVELKFSLAPQEKDELSEIDSRLREVSGVSVTKDYGGNFHIGFLPETVIPPPTVKGLLPLLGELRDAIDKLDDSFSGPEPGIRWKLLDALSQVGVGVGEDTDLSSPSTSREAFAKQVQKILTLLEPKVEAEPHRQIRALVSLVLNTLDWPTIEAEIRKYLLEKLLVFVYFENYAIVAGRIHLPSFVERAKSGQLSPEENTARMLLSFVNLDAEKLVALGSREKKSSQEIQEAVDMRALMVARASLSLSGILADLWKQRRNQLDLAIDGDYLRLLVTDNVGGSRIELEQKSKGFQWFLSFYIVFMTASMEGQRDAVLLLDEPGLHLHVAAQEDLLKVFTTLSEKHQIIYATHSPFMIDLEAPDTVSVLVESSQGTKVSEPQATKDKTALFPLQAALGYSLSRGLYTGQYTLLVENITDLWILSTISQLFKESGRGHIDDDIVITPSGGGQKSALFATMLAGDNMGVGVLLDSDAEGFNVRSRLIESRIVKESNVHFVGDAAQEPGRVMEMEDLLPVSLYLKFVNEAYSRELGKHSITDKELSKGVPIRRYVEEEFEDRGLHFSRFRVARHIMNKLPDVSLNQLPTGFVEGMELLFSRINRIKPAPSLITKVKSETPIQAITVETHRRFPLRAIFSRGRS